jgi:SAM-dependent methyltransferase
MQESIREYVEFFSRTVKPASPIYEFGSRQADIGSDANLRGYFPDCDEYIGCDMQPGTGVDRIMNIHSIDMLSESVPTVLCLDTLEHVEYPRRAVEEMTRILKPDGVLLISSLMNFPIHNHPNDYWRFTPEGFHSLLASFPTSHVGYYGPDDFPQGIFGVGWKKETVIPEEFLKAFAKWRRRQDLIMEKLATKTEDEIQEMTRSQESFRHS